MRQLLIAYLIVLCFGMATILTMAYGIVYDHNALYATALILIPVFVIMFEIYRRAYYE